MKDSCMSWKTVGDGVENRRSVEILISLKTVGDIYITKSPPRVCKVAPHCLQRRTVQVQVGVAC